MLWKHLWNCSCRRERLEDWQDKDIPKGAASISARLSHKHFIIWIIKNKLKRTLAAVCSQDVHDTTLELERIKALTEKALLIQKVLRGYKYRCSMVQRSQKSFKCADDVMTISCLYDLCFLKERIPEKKGSRSCHSEILERTQRQKAVQSGEPLFITSVSKCYNINLPSKITFKLCSKTRSSWALLGCKRRFVPANSTTSIRRSGRQPSCSRPKPEDTWPGRNGNAREMLWSSCRRILGVCWQEEVLRRWKEMYVHCIGYLIYCNMLFKSDHVLHCHSQSPEEEQAHFSLHITLTHWASLSSNLLRRQQFPTLFINVFATDQNFDVSLVTVPTEAQFVVFVSEAPAIRAPVIHPPSGSLRSFPSAVSIHTYHREWLMFIAQLYHAVHLCGSICSFYVSPPVCAGFSFDLSHFWISTSYPLLYLLAISPGFPAFPAVLSIWVLLLVHCFNYLTIHFS